MTSSPTPKQNMLPEQEALLRQSAAQAFASFDRPGQNALVDLFYKCYVGVEEQERHRVMMLADKLISPHFVTMPSSSLKTIVRRMRAFNGRFKVPDDSNFKNVIIQERDLVNQYLALVAKHWPGGEGQLCENMEEFALPTGPPKKKARVLEEDESTDLTGP